MKQSAPLCRPTESERYILDNYSSVEIIHISKSRLGCETIHTNLGPCSLYVIELIFCFEKACEYKNLEHLDVLTEHKYNSYIS